MTVNERFRSRVFGATWAKIRVVLGIGISSLVVAAVAATTPPNLAETLAAQQEVVGERPDDPEVHNDHGNLLMLAGRVEEAESAYQRAIELAPDSALARFNLGVLLQQSGRWKGALAQYKSVLEIEPRHARTYYQMGMLLHSRKQRTKAVEHYARAFAYDPELTFPRANPHIIDNPLATEALLVSRRFGDAPSAEMPRLYGEPDRIADLMLEGERPAPEESEESEADAEMMEASGKTDGRPVEKAASRFEGDAESDEEVDSDSESESDSDSESDSEESEERRTLTPADLNVGSSLGQVGRTPASRSAGRAAGSASQGRDRRTPGRRPRATGGEPAASGKDQGRSVPRYRPGSRLSTGRLELKLLPVEPVLLETLAQLEALDQHGGRAHHAGTDG